MDEQIKKATTIEKPFFGGAQDAAGSDVLQEMESRALSFMLGWFLLKTSRLSSSEVAIIQSC